MKYDIYHEYVQRCKNVKYACFINIQHTSYIAICLILTRYLSIYLNER